MVEENERLRERMLAALAVAPGGSTREVARLVDVAESTADYHLRRLGKLGLVTSHPSGRTRRWFAVASGFCPVLRCAIPEMRRPETLAVASALSPTPISAPALADRTGIAEGTVRWVTAVLHRTFLLSRTRSGRVHLRDGAQRCLEMAITSTRCPEWGRCAVSLAWERERAPERERPPTASR